MARRSRILLVALALALGVAALAISSTGSVVAAVLTATVGLALLLVALRNGPPSVPHDPSRRRLLGAALGGLGLVFVAGGSALGAAIRRMSRPDPRPTLEAMARDLGAEYLELVSRAYHPERMGDVQLLVTPYSSSNYPQESTSLVPNDPRSSHAVVWMYAERLPIVVWSPGLVPPQDHDDRVTLADLAPTTASLMGFDGFRAVDGTALPGIAPDTPPKVIVTLVIDGGGWNVLTRWHGAWPNLRRLMSEGATYRNAICGSFPAVTASTHATIGTGAFPRTHGITGHNVRRDGRPVKAWSEPGAVDPSFLLEPTLADRWTEATDDRAWVGEIGYQVWHLGMLGRGGRPMGQVPVGVYWDELGGGGWKEHHPELYRLPKSVPGLDRLAELSAGYDPPEPSPYDPTGRKAACCFPPIVRYQAELIEATFDSEPIGEDEVTDLLYINYKQPDYSGHIYNMEDPRQAEVLASVDAEIGRLADRLAERFGPGGAVLIVTADHGQCPQIDAHGGVRIDPIQLEEDLRREFGTSVFGLIQNVAPSEVYLNPRALWDAGLTAEHVAAFLADYRYGENIGPYVRPAAVRGDRLDARSFAAVLPTSFIAELTGRDLSAYGETAYPEADPDGSRLFDIGAPFGSRTRSHGS
ncbi:MAG TPA: alkaline phosphatase family protein [Actinomycetota bacterium]|nr:alkaline phosphatase family protein [Actinomycetota bacterium]